MMVIHHGEHFETNLNGGLSESKSEVEKLLKNLPVLEQFPIPLPGAPSESESRIGICESESDTVG